MEKGYYTSAEVAENYIALGCKKVGTPPGKQFLLGMLAGAFVALAAVGANYAAHGFTNAVIGKFVSGTIFPVALMFVILAGAELFTGNCLIVITCLEKKTAISGMLRNWFFVYTGNFAGALVVAGLIAASGQLGASDGLLGAFTIKVAAVKTSLPFGNAFALGVLCNWLVCLAVWMSYAAKDVAGKILAMYFPIWLFVASGYEHCVANMYYISSGLIAKSNPAWLEQAANLGVTAEKLAGLTVRGFLFHNLLPVTLGNIVGGGLFVGTAYWLAYLRKEEGSHEHGKTGRTTFNDSGRDVGR